jgi:hypothetical protein
VIGTLPALTSAQFSTMSPEELLMAGYPPRPDATKNPATYAKWLQIVTQPFNIVSSAGVARLDIQSTTFNGRYGGTGIKGPVPWTALVQDSAGFSGSPDNDYGGSFPLAWGGVNYIEYEVFMFNVARSCPTNDFCQTSFWGGIGGYPVNFFNAPYLTPLIQSGLEEGQLFYDYVNSDDVGSDVKVTLGKGFTLAVNDEICTIGGAVSGSTCQLSTSGPDACFWFWDITQNWTTTFAHLTLPTDPGTTNQGNPFMGATAEWAVELVQDTTGVPNTNSSYLVQSMTACGWNANMSSCTWPTNGDSYIFTAQANDQPQFEPDKNQLNLATWTTFSQTYPDNDPQSWVNFYWENSF